tara:strand:- start:161 stop:1060 length:900 start_codon:yes stop_codon:yes gene_type:complete
VEEYLIKLSVVMSAYNAAEYICESIQSIIDQSFSNYEFIIVNDASTDNTLDLISSFSDPRIIVINNAHNMGLAFSLNKALDLCSGEYVARMDADDIAYENRFLEQVEFLDANKNIIVLGTDIEYFGIDSALVKPNCKWIKEYDKNIKLQLLYGNAFAHPTVMIRKEILCHLDYVYDENLRRSQDYDLWVRLAGYGEFSNLKKKLLKYRVSPDMASIKHGEDQKKSKEIISKLFVELYLNKNKYGLTGNYLYLNFLARTYSGFERSIFFKHILEINSVFKLKALLIIWIRLFRRNIKKYD